MLVLYNAYHLPVTSPAVLFGGIQLSQPPDPRNGREAMAAPEAAGWMEAVDEEMMNLEFHNLYELVPRAFDTCTLGLGWVLHQKFKDGIFKKINTIIVARGNHQHHGIDYSESFSCDAP
jgi:hypothetical protein